MARMKDQLLDENGYYIKQSDLSLRYIAPEDVGVLRLQKLLDMLSSDLSCVEDERELLTKIDQISEERLAREKHMLEQMKLVEARSKNYFGVNKDFDPIWLFRIIPIVIVFTLILMTSLFAHAQNLTVWCLVSDFNAQCIYYNLDSCQTEANQFGGVCLPKQIN